MSLLETPHAVRVYTKCFLHETAFYVMNDTRYEEIRILMRLFQCLNIWEHHPYHEKKAATVFPNLFKNAAMKQVILIFGTILCYKRCGSKLINSIFQTQVKPLLRHCSRGFTKKGRFCSKYKDCKRKSF